MATANERLQGTGSPNSDLGLNANLLEAVGSQTLCKMCYEVLLDIGFDRTWQYLSKPRDVPLICTENHHPTYRAFATAVHQGCYVCTLLWKSIPADILKLLSDPAQPMSVSSTIQESHGVLKSVHLDISHNFRSKLNGARIALRHLDIINDVAIPAVNCGATTNSSSAWDCVFKWLEACTKTHTSCGQKGPSLPTPWYPTRLLDVGTQDSQERVVSIVEKANIRLEGPYVTLSHCWGGGDHIKLTGDTLTEFLSQIPALPKTFDEAVFVARKLGVRYLWIDSLCIIQDDLKDWQTESSQMDQVYMNSLCNIAATASSDSSGGLFYTRPHLIPSLKVLLRKDGERTIELAEPGTAVVGKRLELIDSNVFLQEIENAPLNRRAWVLQEVLLAPRVLHFGHKQLFWECNGLCACESFPDGLPGEITYRGKGYISELIASAAAEEEKLLKFEVWNTIISRYTRARLTFGSDKLVALAGIAKYLQPMFGDLYLAGMWKEELILQLGWFCLYDDFEEKRQSRPTQYRAPSWSWTTVDCKVSVHRPEMKESLKVDPYLKILEANIMSDSDDPTAAVSGGFLLVEGPLNRISIEQGREGRWSTKLWDLDIVFDFFPDSFEDFYILPLHQYLSGEGVREFQDSYYNTYVFLVLTPVKERPGCYNRCGLASVELLDDYWERIEGCFMVQNAQDAPCEEFLGSEQGYRIRIL